MERLNKTFGLAFFIGLVLLFTQKTAFASITGSHTVIFNADIAYEGACNIAVDSPVIFNNDEPILPEQIEAKDAITKQNVKLTLSGCKGFGLIPKIKVVGQSTTEYGDAMFADNASEAKGYGIYLSTLGDSNFKENSNLAATNIIKAADDWKITNSLAKLNGSLPLIAQLTCGDCNFPNRIGGELKANITFEFEFE